MFQDRDQGFLVSMNYISVYTFKSHVLNTNGKVEILKHNYLYGYSPSSHLNK